MTKSLVTLPAKRVLGDEISTTQIISQIHQLLDNLTALRLDLCGGMPAPETHPQGWVQQAQA